MITNHTVAEKLTDYLHHRLALDGLIDWAEQAMMYEEFEDANLGTLRDIVGLLGLANVRAFGLAWEDCEAFLVRLGYQVRVEVAAAE